MSLYRALQAPRDLPDLGEHPEFIAFERRGEFSAWYDAGQWCKANDVSMGTACAGSPVGLMRGDVLIAKWRNLSGRERAQLDGYILGERRNGPLSLYLRKQP